MITIEHIYDAPVKKVWQALSNKDQMRIWYFNVSDFEPIKDFEFHFESGPTGRLYTHLCKVTDAETEKKVAYTWRYEGYAGKSLVTFDLIPDKQGTKLILTHEGLDTLPPEPDFAEENFKQGWAQILGTNLRNFVEK